MGTLATQRTHFVVPYLLLDRHHPRINTAHLEALSEKKKRHPQIDAAANIWLKHVSKVYFIDTRKQLSHKISCKIWHSLRHSAADLLVRSLSDGLVMQLNASLIFSKRCY